jgi:hypothetical protein
MVIMWICRGVCPRESPSTAASTVRDAGCDQRWLSADRSRWFRAGWCDEGLWNVVGPGYAGETVHESALSHAQWNLDYWFARAEHRAVRRLVSDWCG